MNKAYCAGKQAAATLASGRLVAAGGLVPLGCLFALGCAVGMGCVIEARPIAPSGIVVSGPPPEPMPESRPPPARPRAIWIAGYWHWTGMQYVWIPGHWEDGPPGARWRAPRYLLRDGVYYYEPGAWREPPPPP